MDGTVCTLEWSPPARGLFLGFLPVYAFMFLKIAKVYRREPKMPIAHNNAMHTKTIIINVLIIFLVVDAFFLFEVGDNAMLNKAG